MLHNPNCAVVRQGDIRAWCNCSDVTAKRDSAVGGSETVALDSSRQDSISETDKSDN